MLMEENNEKTASSQPFDHLDPGAVIFADSQCRVYYQKALDELHTDQS